MVNSESRSGQMPSLSSLGFCCTQFEIRFGNCEKLILESDNTPEVTDCE